MGIGDPEGVDYFYALKPLDGDATKRHVFKAGEYQTTPPGRHASRFHAYRSPYLRGLEDLASTVRKVSGAGSPYFIIRGEPADPHCDRPVNRRYLGDDADWTRAPMGRRWICIDIDSLAPPEWLTDAPTPDELPKLAEYARQSLPEPFREAACFYQWSASAGAKSWSKVRVHLWFWLDRPGYDPAIRAWFERSNRQGAGVDVALYQPVQPHFVAAPIFEGTNALGGPMTDPLEGIRDGMLPGAPMVILPEEVETAEAWTAREEAEAEAKIQRLEDRRLAIADGRLAIDKSKAHRSANEVLLRACTEIREASEGERHATMTRATLRVFGYVVAGLLDDALAEGALVEAYEEAKQGGTRDIVRAIKGARKKAKPVDLATMAIPTDLRQPDHIIEHTDLGEARLNLRAIMGQCEREGGVHVIRASPGVGKSHAAIDLIFEITRRGGRAVFASPTMATRDESAGKLKDAIGPTRRESVSVLEMRDDRACPEIDTYLAHDRLRPAGGAAFCSGCERNPHATGRWEAACPFWQARRFQPTGPSAVFMTHAIAAHKAAGARRIDELKDSVDWTSITRAAAEGRRVAPWLKATETMIRLTVEEDPFGIMLPMVDLEGERLTDDIKEELLRPIADLLGVDPIAGEIAAVLLEGERIRRFDLAIIDESPLPVVIQNIAITPEELVSMFTAGELEDVDGRASLAALVMMIHESKNEKRRIKAEELADKLDPSRFRVIEAGHYGDIEAEKANDVREWRAVDALRDALASGWGAAYLANGALHLPHIAKVPWANLARTVIVLDGTDHPEHAAAMYGDSMTYYRFDLASPHRRVVWIPYAMGKSQTKADGFVSQTAANVFAAVHRHFDGERTVHFTHKKFRAEGTATSAILEGLVGDVDHFRSATSKGSNTYEHHDTIILDTYHTNGGALESTAYSLCTLAGDDWTQERERWIHTARLVVESGEIAQTVHRVRPTTATADDPVTLVFIDQRSPATFDSRWIPDEQIDPYSIIAEELGEYRARGGAIALLRHMLAASGKPALIPGMLDRHVRFGQVGCLDGVNQGWKRGSLELPYNLKAELDYLSSNDFSAALLAFCRNHFAGDWQEYAKAAGFTVTRFVKSSGGKTVAIGERALTVEDVVDSLRDYEHVDTWIAIGGDILDTADPADGMRAALAKIDRLDFPALASGETQATIGEALGVSARTVRTHLSKLGWTLEDVRREWCTEHGVVYISAQKWRDYSPATPEVIDQAARLAARVMPTPESQLEEHAEDLRVAYRAYQTRVRGRQMHEPAAWDADGRRVYATTMLDFDAWCEEHTAPQVEGSLAVATAPQMPPPTRRERLQPEFIDKPIVVWRPTDAEMEVLDDRPRRPSSGEPGRLQPIHYRATSPRATGEGLRATLPRAKVARAGWG
jgi:hypothetical protein